MKKYITKKTISVIVAVCGILFGIICVVYQYYYYHSFRSIDLSDYITADKGTFESKVFTIESDSTRGKYYYIDGWVVMPGHNMDFFNTKLVLYNGDADTGYVVRLDMVTREEITAYFDDGNSYDACGFQTYIDSKYVEGKLFRIGFIYEDSENKYLIKTDEIFKDK